MATTKKSFGFRLSEQAQKHLLEIAAKTGMNQTAIVEYALAKMATELEVGRHCTGDNREIALLPSC
jgi:predicted transcriptional regulator